MGPQQVRFLILLAACTFVVGCGSGVSASDSAEMRKEFSQDKYEKAMIAAGRGAELEEQKRLEAQRNSQSDR